MPWNFVWGPSEPLNEPIVYNDIHIAGITAKKMHGSLSCCFFFSYLFQINFKVTGKNEGTVKIYTTYT